MTKEELKQEAEESFEKYRITDIDYVVSPYSEDEGEKILMFNNEYDAEEEYFRLYSKGYLAGSEPREKRIAELEKEKCELLGIIQGKDKVIQDLQKENAELSMKRKAERKIFQGIVEKKNDQLTKAKYLISKCIKLLKLYKKTNDLETVEQLENFLKDSEVEK